MAPQYQQSLILSRPLSVFQLPRELLDSLAVRSIIAQPDAAGQAPELAVAEAPSAAGVSSSSGLGCQTCPGASFETPEDQRAHFKSDWHRYNVKAKQTGKTIGAEAWDEMVEGVSSISGSASSDSSDGSSRSRVTKLLKKATLGGEAGGEDGGIDSDEEAELADIRRRAHLRTAVIWFTAPTAPAALKLPADTQFGVHRALFPSLETAGGYLDELKRLQLLPVPEADEDDERRITLLMVAGGHFAGMVVGLRPRGKSEKQDVKGAGEIRVLRHKTFHRYTTRRKQGGSQSVNDSGGGSKAISAGAMLRRYGEQALQEDIRALLAEWEDDIALSERIFLRASTHGKKSFWGYDGAVLDKTDPRIRSFPFTTRRPTQQELLRCWQELIRVKISHLSEEALAAQDEAYMASLQPKKQAPKPTPTPAPAPKPEVPKLSPEEEARRDRQARLTDMVKKGRLDALKDFVSRYRDEVTPQVLGTAAAAGQEDVLRFLLIDAEIDPTAILDGNKRAYDLATSKGARNVFRRAAHDLPDRWDWAAAHVPSGLSEEAAAGQGAKKAERRRGLRDKMRDREKARADAAEAEAAAAPAMPGGFSSLGVPPPATAGPSAGPQKLGGRLGAEGGLAGLSPEMRMQIERERRARAAEARFANLGAK